MKTLAASAEDVWVELKGGSGIVEEKEGNE